MLVEELRKAVLLKLEHVHTSPGGLVKIQTLIWKV